jgi:hypothetical protein
MWLDGIFGKNIRALIVVSPVPIVFLPTVWNDLLGHTVKRNNTIIFVSLKFHEFHLFFFVCLLVIG